MEPNTSTLDTGLVSEQEGQTLARSLRIRYVDVSAKSGDGVGKCFSDLFQVLERKDHRVGRTKENYYTPILPRPMPRPPSSWFDYDGLNQRVSTQIGTEAKGFDNGQPTTGNRFLHALNGPMLRNENCHECVKGYRLRDLVAALHHVAPGKLYVDDIYSLSGPCLMGHIQHWVEIQSGARWDWSPLPSRPRRLNLKDEDVLLGWACDCGYKRWAIVPQTLVEDSSSTLSTNPTVNVEAIGARIAARRSASVYTQPTRASGASSSTSPSMPADAATSQRTGLSHRPTARQEMQSSRTWVILLVRQGYHFRLRQLDASSSSCHDFFVALRSTYFSLRGKLRVWLSVSQYSHCDFYLCRHFPVPPFPLPMRTPGGTQASRPYLIVRVILDGSPLVANMFGPQVRAKAPG
ncbi:uncharacterized protein PG986_010721 [Apiospora aurea]|uniref:Uncharacterized protein n=1 Tax=Apiospora aurea TaxID=335848 RepID=A0ABR1Q338_9PEZI